MTLLDRVRCPGSAISTGSMAGGASPKRAMRGVGPARCAMDKSGETGLRIATRFLADWIDLGSGRIP
jgi:hypothetical protein